MLRGTWPLQIQAFGLSPSARRDSSAAFCRRTSQQSNSSSIRNGSFFPSKSISVSRRCCSSHCNQSSSASLHSCCTVDSLRPASTPGFSASWFPVVTGTLGNTCDDTVCTPVVAFNLYRLGPSLGNIGFDFLNGACGANRLLCVMVVVPNWDIVPRLNMVSRSKQTFPGNSFAHHIHVASVLSSARPW